MVDLLAVRQLEDAQVPEGAEVSQPLRIYGDVAAEVDLLHRVLENLEEGGEKEAASSEAAEERVGQLPGQALEGPALAAPGLHGGSAPRRCVDAAVDEPRLARSSGGGGCHGLDGTASPAFRCEPPLDGRGRNDGIWGSSQSSARRRICY